MSSLFLKSFGAKRLMNSVKLLRLSIKSVKPIQKYPHIIQSYDCIRKIFMILDLSIDFLISFEMCSTSKLSK